MSLEKDLLKGMEDYRYGRFNLLKNNFNFSYTFKGNVKIKNFYRNDEIREGDCVKLTNDFCLQNYDLDLIKVGGNEPKYFHEPISNHFYAIFFAENRPINFWETSFEDKCNLIRESNPFVVDPSFKLVVPFNESGYFIKNFYLHEIRNSSDLVFEKEKDYVGVPLGLKRNGELVSLGKRNGKIGLNFKFSGYKIHNYVNLENTSFVRGNLLGNEVLQLICVNLSKKYVEFIETIKKPKLNLFNLRKRGCN
jgi:hypothetical protein